MERPRPEGGGIAPVVEPQVRLRRNGGGSGAIRGWRPGDELGAARCMELPETFCCERMKADLAHQCDQHSDRKDCPDSVLTYSARTDSYGIMIRNGPNGSAQGSAYAISFCPFCGAALRDLSDQLFAELDAINPDWEWETVPVKYKSADWWREKGL